MNGNCAVCALPASHFCPEHGERCPDHVASHGFCSKLVVFDAECIQRERMENLREFLLAGGDILEYRPLYPHLPFATTAYAGDDPVVLAAIAFGK